MSITDELREFFDGADGYELWCPRHKRELMRIADNIDAALADYIPLPKDANGETIHIGDELDSAHSEDGTVIGIRYYEGGVTLIAVRPHGWDTATWNSPVDYTHAQPDSWERIIEDAQADGVRYHNDGRPSDFDALVERCKRLAGDA